ncbi:MAG: hypothetical protein EPN20_02860 [Magnetospirillum sp.]|nr:MAG: hypothetical protein EPN20_02860 [Magnetospirillum sp.]
MRRSIPLLLVVMALLPIDDAAAKPKHCFSLPEITAEREIRHGIYLREAAQRCNGQYITGSYDMWQKFEAANGVKFKAANEKRRKAWAREFPDDWQYKINHADGRLVTYARNIPRTQGFCDNIDDLLHEVDKRGYGGFSGQAKRLQNEVTADYKVCP